MQAQMRMWAAVLAALAAAVTWAADGPARPSASPTPGLLAFAGVRWTAEGAPSGSALYSVRSDGKALRRLTGAGAWEDAEPAWSPDGRRIAFGRRTADGWRLYVAAADGSALRALTKPQRLASEPAWSPDGRRLVFTQLPAGLPKTGTYAQQVFVIGAAGGPARQLTRHETFTGGAGGASWSPDGKLILFWGTPDAAEGARRDVWLMRPDGTGLRRLLAGATDPAWSPDGSRVAFRRRGDVYVATATGTGLRRLTRTANVEEGEPAWSPDGTRLAWTALQRERDWRQDTQRLIVARANGSDARFLTSASPRFWAAAPAWRPEAARATTAG